MACLDNVLVSGAKNERTTVLHGTVLSLYVRKDVPQPDSMFAIACVQYLLATRVPDHYHAAASRGGRNTE